MAHVAAFGPTMDSGFGNEKFDTNYRIYCAILYVSLSGYEITYIEICDFDHTTQPQPPILGQFCNRAVSYHINYLLYSIYIIDYTDYTVPVYYLLVPYNPSP